LATFYRPPAQLPETALQRLNPRSRLIAFGLAALAGYVDANGFLMTRGYFVSFMSGNSTQLGVGLFRDARAVAYTCALVAAFVLGVMAGATLRRARPQRPEPTILGLITAALFGSAGLAVGGLQTPATLLLAFGMGAENTIFAEAGEVRVSLTYMTGTLVKCGKAIVAALFGGPPFGWAPHLVLWLSLVLGAAVGATAFAAWGPHSLWWPALAAGALTLLLRDVALNDAEDASGA
jgi:uncharacterized membrane protein YoaK (UPF0700 family)